MLTALPHDVPVLARPHTVGAAAVFAGLGLMAIVQLRHGASSEHFAQKFAAAGVTVPK